MNDSTTADREEKKTRVVINALHAKSGGGVTYLRNVLGYFAEDPELEFHLVLHKDQYDLFQPYPENIHLHLLDFRTSFLRLLLWEQFALPVLLRLMAADVTFSPANYGPFLAPRPVILLRNSLSVVGGETRIKKQIYWLGLAMFTWLSLVSCRCSIAVSRYARDQLTFGLKRFERLQPTIVYHGVSEEFHPVPATARHTRQLLVVSDIYVQKNLHRLVDAMSLVVERFPDVILKIAGRPNDKEYLRDIQNRINQLEIQDHFEFLGHCSLEQLLELYNSCTCLVFPSTVETFGNSLVESMACGTPIISSSSAAMPEVLGNSALYFDPTNVVEMADRIIELLENPACAEKLSKAGLRRARKYSWGNTAAETCQVLRDAAR